MANIERADEYVANAVHKSVTKKRLTKLKGGLTARYLYEKPLIEYLNDDEQPHFILAARQNAPTFTGVNAPTWSGASLQGMAMHMITDKRWVMVMGMKGGDKHLTISSSEILVPDYSTGATGHEIKLETPEYQIEVPIGNMYDADEVEAAVDFLEDQSKMDVSEIRAQRESSENTDEHLPEGVRMIAEGKNGQVALFDNKIRISREEIGLIYKLNQLGKGDKEIRLENITSIQLKEPSSFTKGYIQFGQSGYSESDDGAFDAASDENSVLFTQSSLDEFITLREEIEKLQTDSHTEDSTSSEIDPTEQLKNLKELNDQGVLSDEEFKEKKQSLLDQI